MLSTFTGIEIGKRGLITTTVGLDTVGHNLTNASTEGYSRQRVELQAAPALTIPGLSRPVSPGQVGEGVEVQRIERVRDQILEGRIVAQNNRQGYWDQKDKYLQMVEQVYNEPTDQSVRTLMDKFWDGWQQLSLYPEDMAARQTVLKRGQTLLDGIKAQYHSLDQIRTMLDTEIQVGVAQVNDLTRQIGKLNEEISKAQAAGDNPNDLLDKRDLLVEKLSNYINITVSGKDPDEFNIHTDGYQLVQGRVALPLKLAPDQQNEGFSKIVWADTNQTVHFSGGKLAGFFDLRDNDVRGEIQNLDNMTVNFVDLVNGIHRSGYGLNGQTGVDFFVERPGVLNVQGNFDRDGNGTFDHTYLFRITGTHSLQAQEQVGLRGTITLPGASGPVNIDYYPTDTVHDVMARINNSGAEVVSQLDRNGHLTLKATPSTQTGNPDFVIRHVEDSGQFLVGYAGILSSSGAGGAYDWAHANAVESLRGHAAPAAGAAAAGGGPATAGSSGTAVDFQVAPLLHPAGWMAINEKVLQEPAAIAAGLGKDGRPAAPGDGSAALEIAHLRNRPVMVGQIATFDDYFANSVANIGLKGEQAAQASKTQSLVMKNLTDLRQSISGVNVDEELAQMIKFQHGYDAAARFVTTIDRMLDTIINRMGV
ncbi:flagellar hook-associated protein FlgK [Salinispira pacifica]